MNADFNSYGELTEDSVIWEHVPTTTEQRQRRLEDLRCLHGLNNDDTDRGYSTNPKQIRERLT